MTLHLDDARWRAAIDADAVGEASEEQRALIGEHEPQGAEYRAEQQLLTALRDDNLATEGPDDEAAIIASAVDAFLSEGALAPSEGARPTVTERGRGRGRWWRPATLGAGIAAAVAIAVVIIAPNTAAPIAADGTKTAATTPTSAAEPSPSEGDDAPPHPTPAAPATRPSEGWAIASGRIAGPHAPGDVGLPIGTGLEAEDELCLSRRAGRACLNRGARFEARVDGPLVLHEGRAEVRVQDAPEFSIVLDDVTIKPSQYAIVVIERGVAGWSVSVQSGNATVIEQRSRRIVRSGELLARTDEAARVPTPRHVTPKAGELLRRARALRRAGDVDGALTTYAQLGRVHPKSSAALTAAVSVGQLHLQRGDAKRALKAFRRYLDAGGRGLAEDAAYGEIRALRALGKQADAEAAASRFLRAYPQSHYGAKLRP